MEKATFAGGCFWCMQAPFEQQEGVQDVVCGYTGGATEQPGYPEVCSGTTGHTEAIHLTYDPERVSYPELLDLFWRQIDPTDPGGQFADRGSQYQTAIFYHNEAQEKWAEESKKGLERSGKFDKPIATKILEASAFYPAEEHHQGYYRKNPVPYVAYQQASGRERFIRTYWPGRAREDQEKEG